MRPHQSAARPLERANNLIPYQSDTPSLFIPVAAVGKCVNRSTTHMSDVIYELFMTENTSYLHD